MSMDPGGELPLSTGDMPESKEVPTVEAKTVGLKRRRPNGYISFYAEECKTRKLTGNHSFIRVREELTEKWRELPPEEKEKYYMGSKTEEEHCRNLSMGRISSGCGKEVLIKTRCTPGQIMRLTRKFNEEKIKVLTDLGFGSLTQLGCSFIRRDFCRYLVDNFDPDTQTLSVHDLQVVICEDDVHRVMGLNSGGIDLTFDGEPIEVEELFRDIAYGGVIKLPDLEMRLVEETSPDTNLFKVMLVLFIMGTLLCPNSSIKVPREYLYALNKVEDIGNLNWSKLVLEKLCDGVRKFKVCGQQYLSGCVLFLMLFYVDKVKEGENIVPLRSRTFPRWQDWNDSRISKLFQRLIRKQVVVLNDAAIRPAKESTQATTLEELNCATVADKALERRVDAIEGAVHSLKDSMDRVIHRMAVMEKTILGKMQELIDVFNRGNETILKENGGQGK